MVQYSINKKNVNIYEINVNIVNLVQIMYGLRSNKPKHNLSIVRNKEIKNKQEMPYLKTLNMCFMIKIHTHTSMNKPKTHFDFTNNCISKNFF
jgi:hypothetical protein